jgi:hypothetical protein
MVGIAQIVVIVASLGDVNTLGEAYAFGVVWSFVFMSLAMTVLRFKDPTVRQYNVPLNISKPTVYGQTNIPIGIFAVFLVLLSTACVNLLTKETATIWGVGFTAFFMIGFMIAERLSNRGHVGKHENSSTRKTAKL